MAAMPERSDGSRAWPPFPAWCPACTTALRAACLHRAAAMPGPLPSPSARAGPRAGGHVRCHFPLVRTAACGRIASAAPGTPSSATAVRSRDCDRRPSSSPVVVAATCARSTRIGRGLLRRPAQLQAVGGVSFSVQAGKTLAVVGESGLRQVHAGAHGLADRDADAGQLQLKGVDVVSATPRNAQGLRQQVQLVFQNPYGSLNPRKKIGAILEAPLEINTTLDAGQRAQKARSMLAEGGPAPGTLRPLSAHVLRRPAPAHRHCPRPDAQPGAAGGRRAGVGAGRVDPGAGAQPAGRPAAGTRAGLPVHLARSGRGAPHRARRAGDVPGPYRRARAKQAIFSRPLHPYTQALLASTPGIVGSGPAAQRRRSPANCPRRSIRPVAACFPPAARTPSSAAATNARCCARCDAPGGLPPGRTDRPIAYPTRCVAAFSSEESTR
jgi:dipeptide transport system ATP-binding protein